jgi:hypothetical protein
LLSKPQLVFDVIPQWFSSLTMWGVMKTPYYRLPPMPWGIDVTTLALVYRMVFGQMKRLISSNIGHRVAGQD